MSEAKRETSLLTRVRNALRVLSSSASQDESRAIVPLTQPLGNGTAQLSLIRTANPGEYRYDGSTIRAQGFNRHPVVHACIRAVADIVSSVPLVVLKERGNYETRVGDAHPLQKLLDYPAPRFTARQFRARFAVDYLGYGNAFFQMERTSSGRAPFALRAVNPESMQQVWIDTDGDPRRYDYANWSGVIVQVPVEDLLHFKDLDMGRPFEAEVFGYPRGATAIASMMADNEATSYVRQIVTNDGTPTFAVLLSDEATSDDAAAMQERYRQRVTERSKRGTPAFFGAVRDIKSLGFTLADLEFPDLRRVSREDICAAFGVDPRMIGIASASSDAGLSGVQYAEARARLVQHTIEPMLASLEDELNAWLAPEFGDVWITYDHERLRDLVENDSETSMRVRNEYQIGLRTFEESRTALKLSPLPLPTESVLKTAGAELVPAAVAVIDPNAIDADTPTDVEVPTTAATTATPTDDVQGQALNGAQVSSLVEMLTLLAQDALPAATIAALIKAAFPAVPDALVQQMIDGVTGFEPSQLPAAPSETPVSAPAAAMPESEDEEDEGEEVEVEDESEDDESEDDDLEASRAEAKTNFPEEGDDKKVSLRNSKWTLFPVAEAEALKKDYPSIWKKGGNIRGNSQFAKLAPIAKRGGVPNSEAEENAIRLREAWVARHEGDHQLPGVIAQVKWLAVGSRGIDHMRKVISEAKAKVKDAERSTNERTMQQRAYWERAMQELDSTEQTYAAMATRQLMRERKVVTARIANAPSYDEARARVRALYKPSGEFAVEWQEEFTPLITKTYKSGSKQVAGVGASIASAMDERASIAPKATMLAKPNPQDDYSAAVKELSSKKLKADALKAIEQRARSLSKHVGRTTANEVLAAIRAGEMAAMPVEDIARLVARAVYGEDRVDARARMIARTEAAGAMSRGSYDQAQAEGDLFRSKTWLSFDDARDSHLALNGTTIPLNDEFANGLRYPLDERSNDAGEVINCRCVLAYETD